MAKITSYSVGEGDMFTIRHGNGSFTVIDCHLTEATSTAILADIKREAIGTTLRRFLCTHPDQDHFGGIELLDDAFPISNFYTVKNAAKKAQTNASFDRYCALRDGDKSYFLSRGCTRKWLNSGDEVRGGAGIQILWPDIANAQYKTALAACDAGTSFNDCSAVIRYAIKDGASFLWLGDLSTSFMESIADAIVLPKTTVVFAAHHGRASGKIPDSWLTRLDPQIIVIGEAPSRHLHYYTGYQKITQNSAGHIRFHPDGTKLHICASEAGYIAYKSQDFDQLDVDFPGYVGSLTLDTGYTLDG